LGELERSFRRELGELEVSLRSLARSGAGDRTFAVELLASQDDILDRAATVLARATESVAVLLPSWADVLREPLERAQRRGVVTAVRTVGWTSEDPPGDPVPGDIAAAILESWSGEPLLIVADRQVALAAVSGPGGDTGICSVWPIARILIGDAVHRLTGSP
jgi:hypothetical protein